MNHTFLRTRYAFELWRRGSKAKCSPTTCGKGLRTRLFSPYTALRHRSSSFYLPFHIGIEFVAGFCLGGAAALSCVIISDLHRGYREFKRQLEESGGLNQARWDKA